VGAVWIENSTRKLCIEKDTGFQVAEPALNSRGDFLLTRHLKVMKNGLNFSTTPRPPLYYRRILSQT